MHASNEEEHIGAEQQRSPNVYPANERFNQSLIQCAPNIILFLSPDHILLEFNPEAERFFGRKREDVLGKNYFEEFLPDDARQDIAADIKKVLAGEPARGFKNVVIDHNGQERILRWNVERVLDSDNKPIGIVAIGQDITEREKTEITLQESENRYRTVIENAGEGIAVVQDGILQFINPHFKDTTGYSEEELTSGPFIEFVHPDDREKVMEIHKKRLKGEEIPPAYEFRANHKQGNIMWLENNGILIDWDGRPASLNFIRNITERKRAEQVRLAYIHFLESLDQVNQAIQGASDLDQMMTDVLDAALSVFKCDRAWLLYPCDPEAPTWRVPMERTVPEYPGALALDVEVPMDQGVAGVLHTVLDSNGPVKFGPASKYPLPHESAKQFRFKSQISMAIHPKVGKSWMFGLHQCSEPRVWTEEEEKLFEEIGRRIADSMSSLLTLYDLRESQERYRALVENANLGIALISKDFEVLMSNATQGMMMEKDHRDFIGSKCHNEFEKRNEVCPHCPGKRAMETGHPHEVETEGVRADGTKISVRVQASPVYGANGCIEGFVEVVEDITERKQAENALRKSEEKHRSMIELSPDIIVVVNKLGFIVSCNSATQKISGYSKEDLIGRHFTKLGAFRLKDTPKYAGIFAKILKGQWREPFEVDYIRKDGSNGIVEVRVCLLGDGNVQAIATDITERKKAEQALRESEERLKILFESAPDAYYIHDLEGKFVNGNIAAEKLIGYQKEEAIGKSFFELGMVTEADAPKVSEAIAENRDGKPAGPLEITLNHKDGSKVMVETRSYPVDIAGETLILGIARDITERKKSEAALAASEQRFRKFFENEPEYCYMVSPQGEILEANRAVLNTLGYTTEELTRKPIMTIFAPESRQRMHQLITQWEQTGEIRDEEMVIQTKNGGKRTVLLSASQVLDENGKPLHSVSIQRDITERKRAEEALKESEARFRSTFEDSIIGMYRTTPDGRILMGNPAIVRMLGYSSFEELSQRNLEQEGYGVQYPRSAFKERLEAEGRVIGLEANWKKKDGTILSIRESARAIRDEFGNTLYYEGTVEDITERKQSEDALSHVANLLRESQEVANLGHYVLNVTSGSWESSEILDAIFGIDIDYPKTVEGWHKVVHPEQRDEMSAYLSDYVLAQGQSFDREYRIIRVSDGHIRWVHGLGRLEFNEEGKSIRMVGTIQDVTERKMAEEALKVSEAQLKRAQEVAHIGSWYLDFKTSELIWSDETCRIFGVPTGQPLKEADCLTFAHPDDVSYINKSWDAALKGGPYDVEHRIIVDGTVKWVREKAEIEYDTDGKPFSAVGTVQDISNRKRAEEAMKKSSVIINSTTDAVITTDIAGKIAFWNKGAEKIYGYQKKDIIGKPISILYKAEDLNFLNSMIANLLEGKDIPSIEVTCIDKNKKDVEILLSLTSVKDENGNITEFVGITKDITKYKHAEEELKESEKRYRLLVESASDSIFLLDMNGSFIDANPATCDSLARTREEILTLSMSAIDPDWPSKKLINFLRELEVGKPVTIEGTHQRKNKTSFPVEIRLTKVDLDERQVVLALARDIAQRRRLEETLRRKAEAVSHEDKAHVSGIDIEWDHGNGICTFEKLPVLMMWRDTTLAALMSGVQKMVGAERFGLALQAEGRRSVEDDWRVISQFSDFNTGFEAIANIAAVAGWGEWKLIELDTENKQCLYRIFNSWEGLYQKALGVNWGSGMLAGKLAGYCSMLFKENCWADQTAFVAKGDEFDEFRVHTSERSIEKEIENLLGTDKATRADMAVALQNLRNEISMRQDVEKALRESEQHYRAIVEDQTELICRNLSDGTITFVNEAYCRYFAKSRDELIGQKFMPYIPEEDHQKVKEHFASLGPDNPVATHEHRIIIPNGEIRWHQWTNRAIVDDTGKVIEYQDVGRDITQQKLAEKELKENEERFRSLSEAAFEGIAITEKGVMVDVNDAVSRMYGYSLEELKGKQVMDLVAPEDCELVLENIRSGYEGVYEHKGIRKDGSIIDLEVHGCNIEYQGRTMRLTAIRDITERKLAEDKLRESQERLTKAFQASPNLMGIFDMDERRRLLVNDAFTHVTGYSTEEVIGTSFDELNIMVEPDGIDKALRLVKQNGRLQNYVADIRTKYGEIRTLRYHGALLGVPGKDILVFSAEDITEQRKAEKQIKDYQRQLKSLASELSLAEERERRRIATGIHDDIAQKLAMAKFSLQTLQASIKDADVSVSLEKQCELMSQIVADARSLTFELGNPVLYQVGLEAAVESYLTERVQNEFGIECKFTSEGPPSNLGEDIKVVLFQAVRELLANVIKHANASTVEVEVSNSEDKLRIVVKDDGVGFDPAKIGPHAMERGGFGLFNIRERLEYFGGNFEIESRPKSGTCVTMTVAVISDAVT